MRVWPLIEHELKAAVWRREAWRPRRSAALWVIGLWSFFYGLPLLTNGAPPSDTAGMFVCIYCLVAGAYRTFDALSVERRENTLSLLFLTGLTGFQIVLAKLARRGWRPACALLAFLPFFSIEVLGGQLQAEQAPRLAATLFNVLFFSLAAGLFASSLCRSARVAGIVATIVVLGQFVILPFAILIGRFLGAGRLVEFVFLANPFASFVAALEPGPWGRTFIVSMLLLHIIAWGLLLLGGCLLGRSWQEKAATSWRLPWRERLRQWAYGSDAVRAERRRRLLNTNPFYWLASRNRMDAPCVWAFLGAGALLALHLISTRESTGGQAWAAIALFLLCSGAIKYWVGGAASRRLWLERNSGALEFLLSTPLTVPEIVRGQWLALRRRFGRALLALIVAGAAGVYWLSLLPPDSSWRPPSEGFVLWAGLALLVLLPLDMIALGWSGMSAGMREKSHKAATNFAFSRVVVWPNLLFVIYLLADLTVRSKGPWSNFPDPTFYLGIWFALGFMSGLTSWLRFRRASFQKMRTLAAERFGR